MIGLVCALGLFAAFRYTSFGFAIDTVGHNPQAARYAGIAVQRQMMLAMVLGGALAGLAGTFEILGVKYRLFHMFSAGYGFDGIVVAFMAAASPILVPIAALFLGGLKAGAQLMQRAVGVESTVVDAIQGLVVIFVAAGLALRFEDSRLAAALRRRQAGGSRAGEAEAERWSSCSTPASSPISSRPASGSRSRSRSPRSAACSRSAAACSTSASRA